MILSIDFVRYCSPFFYSLEQTNSFVLVLKNILNGVGIFKIIQIFVSFSLSKLISFPHFGKFSTFLHYAYSISNETRATTKKNKQT